MNKLLKWVVILLSIVAVCTFCYSYFNDGLFRKTASPKKTVNFQADDLKLKVIYSRPSKRGREIFGGIVPYNDVWRTGANEATIFQTNNTLIIGNDTLSKGKYTLWTIPNDTVWKVIFNAHQYPWGVDESMRPMRDPQFDALNIAVPVEHLDHEEELFTIAFDNSTDNLYLTMSWDMTKIAVPIK